MTDDPMTLAPVNKVQVATRRIRNASAIARGAAAAGVPFHVACAFAEQESHGQMIWGHDPGGVHYVKPPATVPVTMENFLQALVQVMKYGAVSQGCGIYQITYAGSLHTGFDSGKRLFKHRDGGYWSQALEQDLYLWEPADNALFALQNIIKPLLVDAGAVSMSKITPSILTEAAAVYNGGPRTPNWEYGREVAALDALYRKEFGL